MTPTERKRIEKEAEAFIHKNVFGNPDVITSMSTIGCYIAGATAEHDKARNQAIQDCIDIVSLTPGDENVIPKLEQLKTKP